MRKKLLWKFLIMLLILCVFSIDIVFSVDIEWVSTVEYPAIMVVPNIIMDENLTPGTNFTVSIYTDYNGSDVWSYEFTLSYNASVLHIGANKTDTWTGNGTTNTFYTSQKPVVTDSEEVYVNETLMIKGVNYFINYETGWILFFVPPSAGVEVKVTYLYGVVNGDLITTDKDPSARFTAGNFNNTLGELSLTVAYFFYTTKPVPTTSGPGILANITFTVVGYGSSNIILGNDARLIGWTDGGNGEAYDIINARYDPTHIQHGYFSNKILGDVNGDRTVNAYDLFDLSKAYGSKRGDPSWNPEADLNRDDKVNSSDLSDLSRNYGRSI